MTTGSGEVDAAGSRGRASTAGGLRAMALWTFVLGALGTGVELLLIDHVEDYWQMAPVGLLGLGLLVLIIHCVVRRAGTVWGFRGVMLLFIGAGVVGGWLHYEGKAEFKKELNPDLAGMTLFWETIRGSAVPPVMAPAMMIQLALLGLAWTYRHPALFASKHNPSSSETGELP
jgi:hypothetical protein